MSAPTCAVHAAGCCCGIRPIASIVRPTALKLNTKYLSNSTPYHRPFDLGHTCVWELVDRGHPEAMTEADAQPAGTSGTPSIFASIPGLLQLVALFMFIGWLRQWRKDKWAKEAKAEASRRKAQVSGNGQMCRLDTSRLSQAVFEGARGGGGQSSSSRPAQKKAQPLSVRPPSSRRCMCRAVSCRVICHACRLSPVRSLS